MRVVIVVMVVVVIWLVQCNALWVTLVGMLDLVKDYFYYVEFAKRSVSWFMNQFIF